MADTAALLAELAALSPAAGDAVDRPARDRVRCRELVAMLVETDPGAGDEYRRFVGIRNRCLDLAPARDALRSIYSGRRILVTGATGCIGTQLLGLLAALDTGPITSVTRGRRAFVARPGVRYVHADVSDAQAMSEVFRDARPDVVFHLAAQRDPGLAEKAVLETVRTNAVGTLNVLRAARATDVGLVCHASTGKAMRYFTRDVYAITKKLAEWQLSAYAAEGRAISGVRFTHVIDNSIVLENFRSALDGGALRIHDPAIQFYVQSAVESAQLLLMSGVNAARPGRMASIRNLGEPVRLLQMALGLIAEAGARPLVWLTGYDPGYESGSVPGLYDPRTAGDVSPLINALEAQTAAPCEFADELDTFGLTLSDADEAQPVIEALQRQCREGDPAAVIARLHAAVVRMAELSYRGADPDTLTRMQTLASRSGTVLPATPSHAVAS